MKGKVVTKLLAGAVLGIAAALFVWLLAYFIMPDLFHAFEARTYDTRVTSDIRDVPEQSIEEIVIVDIDGRSVSELGKFSQWSRSYYPRIIRYLNEGGAAAIGLDIIFDKDIREPEADETFARAIREAGNVFTAVYFEKEDSLSWRYRMTEEPPEFEWRNYVYSFPEGVIEKLPREERIGNDFLELLNVSHAIGHVNFEGDVDGVVRRIHLFSVFNDHAYPALALQMYLDLTAIDSLQLQPGEYLYLHREGSLIRQIPVDERGNMLIHYAGGFKTYRYISFYDVLEQRIPAEYFRDKIVLVGTSLPGLFDLRSAPFNPSFPGVEIHANILYTLLSGEFIQSVTATQEVLLLLGLGILIGVIIIFLPPVWSGIVIILAGIIHTFAAYNFYWEAKDWIPIVSPVLTLVATFTLVYIYKYNTEEKGKRFIKKTFSHFVTQSVVDELLSNPDKIKLGGEKKNCSVLFSDVAGFTTIAEQLTPEALVRLLNEYLTQMTNIVFKYQGMLDKYEGDAIMAVFGAPISQTDHAFRACSAALEMQKQLVLLRDMWGKQGRPQLTARCGINSGQMIVGNMGSENRFDYTVMGDAVNLGARLEPANKQYRTRIMIGSQTYQDAKEGIIVRQLDLLRVKGKTEPVKVYELVGLQEEGISEKKKQILDFFHQGFDNYLAQNWEIAVKYFRQVTNLDPTDGPSITYLRRCEQFLSNPPGKDWDGVFTMQSK